MITEAQRRAQAPYCGGCGKPVASGPHVTCRNDLPRFSDCDDPGLFESKQFGPNGAHTDTR